MEEVVQEQDGGRGEELIQLNLKTYIPIIVVSLSKPHLV